MREPDSPAEPTRPPAIPAGRRRYGVISKLWTLLRVRPRAADWSATLQLKCVGDVRDRCRRCSILGMKCLRSHEPPRPNGSRAPDPSYLKETRAPGAFPLAARPPSPLYASASRAGDANFERPSPLSGPCPEATKETPSLGSRVSGLVPLGELPKGKELEDLVQLYFLSVHRECLVHRPHTLRRRRAEHGPFRFRLLCLHSPAPFPSTPRQGQFSTRADPHHDCQRDAVSLFASA